MIVVCTNCQAKFRVADEKIGPRGAKVRCSRCRTTFVVHPDVGVLGPAAAPPAAAAPAPDLPGPQATENPFVTNPVRAPGTADASDAAAALGSVPPPLPPGRAGAAEAAPPAGSAAPTADAGDAGSAPMQVDDDDLLGGAPTPDPFALAGADAPPPDPFALAGADAPPPDPFAPAGGDAPAPDPFAASAGGPDPFAPAAAAGAGGSGLPLTDLSDLLAAAAAPAPEAPAGTEEAADAPEPTTGGLALEERLTPPPMRVTAGAARPFDDLDAGHAPPQDPFAGPGGHAFDAASFDGEPLPGAEALALANEPAPAPAAAPEVAPPPEEPVPAPEHAAPPAPDRTIDRTIEAAPSTPARRGSRLRSIAVNAVALVALLAIALAILVVWRSDGPIEAGSLRPAAIAATLRSGRSAGPFATADLRSGEYEREEGPPILFVRGNVVSRVPAGVLRVAVEVVREGRVVARGEALAGAVPTAEELWRAKDAASLDEIARSASARAARKVRPGDPVPFLVAIGEHPEDLEGASLRVNVTPAAGAP